MSNLIFKKHSSKKPMGNHDLAIAYSFGIESEAGESYDESRISGEMCSCNGNGEFVLEPPHSTMCREGGKRYMECRNCGGVSHL